MRRPAIAFAGILTATLLTGSFSVSPASAEEAGATGAGNRFQLERTESGVVRLDMQTGAMTLCRDDSGQLTCRMAADERAAYEKELDLLEKRVAALEKQAGEAKPRSNLPSDDEIETSLSIMERFMRRFMGLIEEFRDEDKGVAPNRT